MSDRLSAIQLEQVTGPDVRTRPRYGFTIDAVDYSSRLLKVGKIKWSVYNRHPNNRGSLRIPVCTVELDNRDGLFAVGNPAGPFSTDEIRVDATLRVTVDICSTKITVLDFTGGALEPFSIDNGVMRLGIQHAIHLAADRVWKREDRSSAFWTSTTTTRDLTP